MELEKAGALIIGNFGMLFSAVVFGITLLLEMYGKKESA